ncbi:MAG TPA: DNA-directed RNA polymerase subunit alpha [Brevefilum sp.]|nr:DNA-directed RNA polymerase subunit alpha [Brevefilum sp.]HOR19982.1 DNA-directed RNA polymerase subunit alpha [Brevefilum sp.]
MVKPKVERIAEARNYGKFLISPLERGFGATIGNALRRVLLSSLEGVAVTSIRITDVAHEFSDIEGVREDVIQLILQFKQLRMKMYGLDVSHLRLEVDGEGTVTSADIICPPEVEIINPDLYLFTVDSNQARFDIDITVERGRGYSLGNERSGNLPIGELVLDAIFSPVRKVNWTVGSARVGRSTDYDSVEFEIWTDGSIAPEEAMSQSSRILIDHLRYIAGISEELLETPPVKSEPTPKINSEIAEMPIENLDLTVRVFNSLKRTGITHVGDVLELLNKGEDAILSIRNFGEKSLVELREKMIEKGFLEGEKEEITEK